MTPLGKSRGGTPMGERPLQRASRTEKCGGYGSAFVGVPLPYFFLRLHFVVRSNDRDGAGPHRLCPLTKIGAESEGFVALLMSVTTTRMQGAS
jgi:hypothetical protein